MPKINTPRAISRGALGEIADSRRSARRLESGVLAPAARRLFCTHQTTGPSPISPGEMGKVVSIRERPLAPSESAKGCS